MKKLTEASWVAALNEVTPPSGRPEGEEWFTVREAAEVRGESTKTVDGRMRRQEAQGKAESQIRLYNGKYTRFYRIKGESK